MSSLRTLLAAASAMRRLPRRGSLLLLGFLALASARPLVAEERPEPLPAAGAASPSAVIDSEVIAAIDAAIRQGWSDAGVSPSADATDAEWCRRVYLDLLGRIPAVDELEAFLADKHKQRRAALVDRLLGEEYVEDYARNWSTIWSNLLIGRARQDDDRRSLVNRDGMRQYLRRAFLTNKPYDQLVFELVAADGANTPGESDYNGAVNFLLDNLQENATTATAKTARYFLGLQVQCTQCHNHPFNDWKQDQFWGMNAFFRQVAVEVDDMRRPNLGPARLVDADFAGESGAQPQEAEVYYELRNGQMRSALPTFIDGTQIGASGYVRDVNRRDELARLIVASPYLSRAIVNRTWGHFLGYGFTRPVDDLGPHNPPSHPELLEQLAASFVGGGCDLKRLMRWIVLSEPYARSSRTGRNNAKDDPTLGEKPLFSRFYLRQMRAEELYESLLVATAAHKTRGSFEAQERTKAVWLSQFTIAFGTDEGDDATTFNGTIPQALTMMNGDLVQQALSVQPGSFLHGVATGPLKPAAKLQYLYLAALARRPTARELELANEFVATRGGDSIGAMQDIWWALLNSNEFILNH
jgi:Protein of unknown function (DUF1549)/Protein of unknown function (DUF1553)